jgi:ABC-type uncharacterized transport system permease subunit
VRFNYEIMSKIRKRGLQRVLHSNRLLRARFIISQQVLGTLTNFYITYFEKYQVRTFPILKKKTKNIFLHPSIAFRSDSLMRKSANWPSLLAAAAAIYFYPP